MIPWPLFLLQRFRRSSVDLLRGLADEDLYRRFAQGEEEAFEVLLQRYGDPVHGYLFRYFGDRELAADLSQEAFLRLVSAAREFRGDSSFRTFLFRIVRNLCIDQVRSRAARPPVDSLDQASGPDPDAPALGERLAGSGPDPSAGTFSGEVQQALQEALARLSPALREVFLMRAVEGLRFPEIAAILGVNENTVRGQMHTAVTRLRRQMAAFSGEPEEVEGGGGSQP